MATRSTTSDFLAWKKRNPTKTGGVGQFLAEQRQQKPVTPKPVRTLAQKRAKEAAERQRNEQKRSPFETDRGTIISGGREIETPKSRQMARRPASKPQPMTGISGPTPAAPRGDDAMMQSIAETTLRNRFGESLSDDQVKFLARQQVDSIARPQDVEADIRGAVEPFIQDVQKQQEDLREELRRERLERMDDRERQLALYEEGLRRQFAPQIARAREEGKTLTDTAERLLGASGRLTTAPGFERLKGIERDVTSTLDSYEATIQQQLAIRQAELEGADSEVLSGMKKSLNALKERQNELTMNLATDLIEAKQVAQQQGDEARMQMVQDMLDSLSTEKLATEYDNNITKQMNDGFLYGIDPEGKPRRLTDAEGNIMEYKTEDELDEFLTVSDAKALGLPFGSTRKDALGKVPVEVPNPQDVFKNEQSLRKEFGDQAPVKDYAEMAKNFDRLTQAQEEAKTGGSLVAVDQALITVYNKLLDPTSVVRESEYARTSDDIAFLEGLKGKAEKVSRGGAGLTTRERDSIVRMAERFMEASAGRVVPIVGQFDSTAIEFGLNPDRVVTIDREELFKFAGNSRQAQTPDQLLVKSFIDDVGREPTLAEFGELVGQSISRDRYGQAIDFSQPLSTGQKGSSLSLGQITGYGSPYWKYGLDIDLRKGDPVRSDVDGKVVAVRTDRTGFGKQVKIRANDGREWWYSHLDGFDVRKGQNVRRGTVLGKGGNTGRTIPGRGGDGSHLDLTVKRPDGSFESPQMIARELSALT